MNKRELKNWICLAGMGGFIFYILHDIVGALNYPGYDWMKQAVSDLTSVTSPSFMIANSFSSIYAMLSCLSCTMVCVLIQSPKHGNKTFRIGVYLFTIMNWVSAIGYSLFPLSESGYSGSFQDVMHLFVVTILVVVLSIVSLALIAVGCLKKPKYKSLAICSMVALTLMFVGAIGVQAIPLDYFGIVERFSTYSAVAFSAVLGIYGFLGFEAIQPKES